MTSPKNVCVGGYIELSACSTVRNPSVSWAHRGKRRAKNRETIKASDTLEHQPTVWPVPYACAQPYHPGLVRPHQHGIAVGQKYGLKPYIVYPFSAEEHPFKHQLHTRQVGAGGWEPHGSSPTACAGKVDQPREARREKAELPQSFLSPRFSLFFFFFLCCFSALHSPSYPGILVPRGRAPFGQHQESRPLASPSEIPVLIGFVNTIE